MMQGQRASWHRSAHCSAIAGLASLLGLATVARAEEPPLVLELNKLEPQGKACRVYLVIDNRSDATFEAFKLDLVLFRTDGIIDRQLLIDLAPLRAEKKGVKVFDLDALACDAVGSILVNQVTECRNATGPVADCADRLRLSSRSGPPLTK